MTLGKQNPEVKDKQGNVEVPEKLPGWKYQRFILSWPGGLLDYVLALPPKVVALERRLGRIGV